MKPRFFVGLLCVALLTGCMEEPADTTALYDPFSLEDTVATTPLETAALSSALPLTFSLPYAAGYTLDPITCSSGMQQTLGSLLYESLFYLDTSFAPQSQLCHDYVYDSETFTYTLTLRTDVLFSDGTPLTAKDVCDTLVRAKASQRYGARFGDVVAVKELETGVSITLSQANTQFIALLDIPIVKSGTEGDDMPVGTGAYAPVTQDNGSVLLGQNPHWWQDLSLPLTEIYLVDCPNQDLMQYSFTTHDVQLLVADLIGVDPLRASGNISYQTADTTTLHYLGMNMETPLLQNATVRQTLSLGLDRSSLVSAFLSGHGVVSQFPVSPISALYPDDLDVTYQSTAFAQALEEAGLLTGEEQTLRLIVNSENSFKVATANQIAHSLTQGNLTIRVQPLAWSAYLEALELGDYDLYYGEVQLTADWNLTSLLSTNGALNYGGYGTEAMDSAILNYLQGSNPMADMEALCQLFQEEMPILPLCFKTTAVLSQTGVLSSTSHTQANPFYQFSTWTVHLGE